MTSRRLHLARPTVAGALLLLLVTSHCGKAEPEPLPPQEDYLQICSTDADCGALNCICGVCTTTCRSNDMCQELAKGSRCVVDECVGASVCELPCSDDAACSVLGEASTCSAGRCERPPLTPPPIGVGGAEQDPTNSDDPPPPDPPCDETVQLELGNRCDEL